MPNYLEEKLVLVITHNLAGRFASVLRKLCFVSDIFKNAHKQR